VVKHVEANLSVCTECGHHFRIGAKRRIDVTLDPDSFEEMFAEILPQDPLQFAGKRSYAQRLHESQERTGLKDAVVCGTGTIMGRRLMMCTTDSGFLMGSMGSVVGEKITRAAEYATENKLPLLIVSGSGGGARMDEGALSLMQMAKTSAALGRHAESGSLFISLITNPTYGGVSASFATLGDILMAEPRAQMGFTGPRVIQQTIKAELPEGFQTAEFLMEHGQLDLITPRKEIRSTVATLIDYLAPHACPEPETESAEDTAEDGEAAGEEAGEPASVDAGNPEA
jgi:acetyl-CoA carboxylase carboxyl transferase subunit beta